MLTPSASSGRASSAGSGQEKPGALGQQAEGQDIPEDRVQVIILTSAYRIRGFVTLIPGARLTDYITESKEFIALTEAEVRNTQDQLVLSAPFLDVSRAHIHVIVPADITNKSAWKSHWESFRNQPGEA